jgi:hypothetical protein
MGGPSLFLSKSATNLFTLISQEVLRISENRALLKMCLYLVTLTRSLSLNSSFYLFFVFLHKLVRPSRKMSSQR